jgi:hypothetical protein
MLLPDTTEIQVESALNIGEILCTGFFIPLKRKFE